MELSEDDFVQLLNLETKKNLVENAGVSNSQQIIDKIENMKNNPNQSTSETMGEAIMSGMMTAGPGGAGAAYGAVAFATTTAAAAVGGPVAFGRWVWGKAKEMVRTYKVSYQNDGSKNKVAKAIWRAIKYPLFKVPLVNKMRRDFDFNATPSERKILSEELRQNRIKNTKKELRALAKNVLCGAGIAGGIMGVVGLGAPDRVGTDALLELLKLGTIYGATIGAGVYAVGGLVRIAGNYRSKKTVGKELVDQAMNNRSNNENQNMTETNQVENQKSDFVRQQLKAGMSADESLSHLKLKNATTNAGNNVTFVRSKRKKSATQHNEVSRMAAIDDHQLS